MRYCSIFHRRRSTFYPLECVKSHRSISGTLEAIFVYIGDRFMSIVGWSSDENDREIAIERGHSLIIDFILSINFIYGFHYRAPFEEVSLITVSVSLSLHVYLSHRIAFSPTRCRCTLIKFLTIEGGGIESDGTELIRNLFT